MAIKLESPYVGGKDEKDIKGNETIYPYYNTHNRVTIFSGYDRACIT